MLCSFKLAPNNHIKVPEKVSHDLCQDRYGGETKSFKLTAEKQMQGSVHSQHPDIHRPVWGQKTPDTWKELANVQYDSH